MPSQPPKFLQLRFRGDGQDPAIIYETDEDATPEIAGNYDLPGDAVYQLVGTFQRPRKNTLVFVPVTNEEE